MNLIHPEGALHSFSIKNNFHDKMDLRLFYLHVTNCNKIRVEIIFGILANFQ